MPPQVLLRTGVGRFDLAIDVSEINATEASEEKARRPTSCRPHKLTTKATKVPLISDTSISTNSPFCELKVTP